MVNHGLMSHSEKDSVSFKINHGQGWSTTFITVYNIYLRVYIPCVYNICPSGLILFNYDQPCFIKSIVVNHGPMSHCDKLIN